MIKKGILYVISAPSGTGKSSLIRALLNSKLSKKTHVSVSHTTRLPRSGESNSEHYYFVDKKEFKSMIDRNDLLEYAEIFGNYYGTSRKYIEQTLINGIDIILDIDWQGARQIRRKIPKSCSIFILPPSKEELSRRLYYRKQDSKEAIKKRIAQAVSEINHYTEYDYLVINDNFDVALKNLKTIICAEHLRVYHQSQTYNSLITKFISSFN